MPRWSPGGQQQKQFTVLARQGSLPSSGLLWPSPQACSNPFAAAGASEGGGACACSADFEVQHANIRCWYFCPMVGSRGPMSAQWAWGGQKRPPYTACDAVGSPAHRAERPPHCPRNSTHSNWGLDTAATRKTPLSGRGCCTVVQDGALLWVDHKHQAVCLKA